jgi:hypothetical protein
MKNCFQTIRMTNTYVFDYEKTNQLQLHLIEEFLYGKWDYLDAIYGDKNIYSTPETFKSLIMAEIHPNS